MIPPSEPSGRSRASIEPAAKGIAGESCRARRPSRGRGRCPAHLLRVRRGSGRRGLVRSQCRRLVRGREPPRRTRRAARGPAACGRARRRIARRTRRRRIVAGRGSVRDVIIHVVAFQDASRRRAAAGGRSLEPVCRSSVESPQCASLPLSLRALYHASTRYHEDETDRYQRHALMRERAMSAVKKHLLTADEFAALPTMAWVGVDSRGASGNGDYVRGPRSDCGAPRDTLASTCWRTISGACAPQRQVSLLQRIPIPCGRRISLLPPQTVSHCDQRRVGCG